MGRRVSGFVSYRFLVQFASQLVDQLSPIVLRLLLSKVPFHFPSQFEIYVVGFILELMGF